MALYRIFRFLFILNAFHVYCLNDDIKKLVVSNIGELCPENNICGVAKQRTPAAGYTSCCSDCSCEEDCHTTKNCCFPKGEPEMSKSKCFSMVYPPPLPTYEHTVRAYDIITSEPDGGCLNRTFESHAFSAPWGDLYPVYSTTQRKLFINQSLAECYGALGLKQFDVTLICQKAELKTVEYDMASYLQTLQSLNVSRCQIYFQYTGNQEDLVKEQCVINPIDTCDNSSLGALSNTQMTFDDVQRLCKSNFYSPSSTLYANYKNIFCQMICREDLPMASGKCRNVIDLKSGGNEFTALIGPGILQMFTYGLKNKPERGGLHYCSKSGQERALLCPSSMVRSRNGNCIHPDIRISQVYFFILLKLTPKTPLPKAELLQQPRDSVLSWLYSRWPKQWLVTRIFYENPLHNNSNINNLFLECYIETKNNRLSYMVEIIARYMRMQWKGSIASITYTFEQSFSKFKSIRYENHGKYIEDVNGLNVSLIPLSTLYVSTARIRKIMPINKMFYCHQVQLAPHEFILEDNNRVLRLTNYSRQGVFLGAEFSFNVQYDGLFSARICLEDSDLQLCSSCENLWNALYVHFTIIFALIHYLIVTGFDVSAADDI